MVTAGLVIVFVTLKAFALQTLMFCLITGTSVDAADLKLAFAALTTVLLEAAKLDKDELSLRYCCVLAFSVSVFLLLLSCDRERYRQQHNTELNGEGGLWHMLGIVKVSDVKVLTKDVLAIKMHFRIVYTLV